MSTNIKPTDTTLWLLPYNNANFAPSALAVNSLSSDQLNKFNRCIEKRQKEYLLGRLLLRFALQKILNKPTDHLDIIDQDGLPPHVPLAQQYGIHFSISHSHNLIGVITGIKPVQLGSLQLGLDIELIKPVNNFDTVRLFCNEKQKTALQQTTDQQKKTDLYYFYWTLKEAYLKAHHKGIGDQTFKVIDFQTHTQKNRQPFLTRHYQHIMHDLDEQYRLAVYCSAQQTLTTNILQCGGNLFHQFSECNQTWQSFDLKPGL